MPAVEQNVYMPQTIVKMTNGSPAKEKQPWIDGDEFWSRVMPPGAGRFPWRTVLAAMRKFLIEYTPERVTFH